MEPVVGRCAKLDEGVGSYPGIDLTLTQGARCRAWRFAGLRDTKMGVESAEKTNAKANSSHAHDLHIAQAHDMQHESVSKAGERSRGSVYR